MSSHLSFHLSPEFVKQYENKEVRWGFAIGGGNSLGELVYLNNYSRLKEDGTKERWHETCERVVNGMYSVLKDHCAHNRTAWNSQKAQRSAEDAYERMWSFKWLPPGRGIWMMGSPFVAQWGSASLNNCALLSTEHLGPRNPTKPFTRLMEMSMLGIGVGFDTAGAGKLTLHAPVRDFATFVIPDSREGWSDSIDALLRAFFLPNQAMPNFDYSLIRPAGSPLLGFGGTAAGPEPLKRLHEHITTLFRGRNYQLLSVTDIVDVMNLIGKCVVAGSSRRSAEIALGAVDDKEFLHLKDPTANPERCGEDGWAFLSNNSVLTSVGTNHDHLVDLIAANGEPGLIYLDLARRFGRLIDPPNDRDYRVQGVNPCAEMFLEGGGELCTLVECFPTNHDTLEDFKRTLKHAYLYGKAVTLLPTHWPETNEIMTRNRRIGCSLSGIAQFAETRGTIELRTWMNESYAEVQRRDVAYSEWLGVRESIKTTTVKPSGSVSILAGVWPGVHWPEETTYLRRMRFRATEPIVAVVQKAGYNVEPDVMDPTHTVVATFPTRGPQGRSTREVSVWEKVSLAVLAQRYWSDNAVSATFTFREDERDQIGPLLRFADGQLKTMSFLPILDGGAYAQMPYEHIEQEDYEQLVADVKRLDLRALYRQGKEAEGERFCTNDTCELL